MNIDGSICGMCLLPRMRAGRGGGVTCVDKYSSFWRVNMVSLVLERYAGHWWDEEMKEGVREG